MARPAGELRSPHHLLQSLRPVAAGVWDRIMDALAAGRDATVQMMDTSVVREIARALISMMARSTTCSKQRPDTLMQDRLPP
jgi:hypothetical protein